MNGNKSREELKQAYKDRQINAGIFQIKNKVNGKVLLGTASNIEGIINSQLFQLNIGSHRNKAMQTDWTALGENQFSVEILETIAIKDDPKFNLEDELQLLEEIWLEKLNLTPEMLYNAGKIRIR